MIRQNQKRIEKLNLVLSYPIDWSVHRVFEDFIQNFFDAIGCDNFSEDFIYSFDEEEKQLVMKSGIPFSMDWLRYIGVSTKRGDKLNQNVGRFGDGFKIAALSAYRDHHFDVQMESEDWKLRVTEAQSMIAGSSVPVLAYEVEKRKYSSDSILTLSGVNGAQYGDFLLALKRFFFDQNPSFGPCIMNNKDYAIYGAKEEADYGGVFACKFNRGTLGVPLYICDHHYQPTIEDREREQFGRTDKFRCILNVFRELKASEAYKVLEILRPWWWNTESKGITTLDWREPIGILIETISTDDCYREQFAEKYGELLLADSKESSLPFERGMRNMAMNWFRTSKYRGKRQMVVAEFFELGIDALEDLCREEGGFAQYRDPNGREKKFIRILELVAVDVFGDLICYVQIPPCRIIVNKPPEMGSAHMREFEKRSINSIGLQVKYCVMSVSMRSGLIEKDMFGRALSVYMHELLHQFGGDSSMAFRKALLALNLRMMQRADEIEKYHKMWNEIEDERTENV